MARCDRTVLAIVFLAVGFSGISPTQGTAEEKRLVIVSPENGSVLETLAAREIARYVYLRTGNLPSMMLSQKELPANPLVVVVGRTDRPIVAEVARRANLSPSLAKLTAQSYRLKTVSQNGARVLLVAGADDVGTLYGAYRLAEHLGVRFFLDGDVVPDDRAPLGLPDLDEEGKPLFDLRGIQPFHDFPEGPDWWNLDDYRAIIAQLPKLRMNFIGLHTYPEERPNAEPTVWIGLPDDVGESGRVKFSYPSSYQNTLRGNWGYSAKKTGDFIFGGSLLFDGDAYGADVMRGFCPQPETPEDCNEVFNRTGDMLREAFQFAHALGIKTCVGTETPLIVPKRVQEHLKGMGKNPADPRVIQELYEGIFLRASQVYPLDYYWFWTPEGWTWQGVSGEEVQKTNADIQTAYAGAKEVKAPFQLATCGWVLGPQGDRAMFDRIFPKDMPVSCINRQVGKEPIDPAFAEVKGRPKWAIPWLEDDPALTSVQLWAGRMRRDAADALRYGCTGLMGIHWRTRVLGPNVLALAWAAWDQSGWGEQEAELSGPVGGQIAAFPNNPIEDTDDDPLYQTVRYDVSAYRFALSNGKYRVVLHFCEPHYGEAGKRVFGVKLEGKVVIDKLDIFGKVGQNKALDYTFEDVEVTDGRLDIDFVYEIEMPCIAAISIRGDGVTKKVNCGGPAYKDFEADPMPSPRDLPTKDFYRDWALHMFGHEIAAEATRIFDAIDGVLPRSSDWVNGPGGLQPDSRPWEEVKREYAFVDELEALRAKVRGAGNLDRFDYWLDSFRYMRAASHVRCVWARYNEAMKKVNAEKDARRKADLARETALPLRRELVRVVAEVYGHLLATVSNPGEMGTVANWDQHILPTLLTQPGEELTGILGEPLPRDSVPSADYHGRPRLLVPTVCSSVGEGEVVKLKVIVLSGSPPREAAVFWRVMGMGDFSEVPLTHIARGVYSAEFPPDGARGAALEYYVKAVAGDETVLHLPATAPHINQTLVVMPGAVAGR